MGKLEASAEWRGGLEYRIRAGNHCLTTDAPEVYGGEDHGPKPTHMLLAGLMGCTGMDVALLLKKMRVPVEKIDLDSSADVAPDDPHVFRSIELNYRFVGDELAGHERQVLSAVRLSKQKYCCVSIMLGSFCPISFHVFINGAEAELGEE